MLHHVACAGQTVAELAKGYGCPAEEIARVNGLAVGTSLVAGVIVWIPGTGLSEGLLPMEPARPTTLPAPPPAELPVLRLPATIFTALRHHAERTSAGRLMLHLLPAGEAEVTHLHLPGNSQS